MGTYLSNIMKVLVALKNSPRTGWVQRGVPPCIAETIASHMYEAALLCLVIGHELIRLRFTDEKTVLDSLAIIIVHDVPEAIAGDINKYVSGEIGELKKHIEIKTLEIIDSGIMTSIYKKYSEANSTESILARICDKLATYTQALRYFIKYYDVCDIISSSKKDLARLINMLCHEDQCYNELNKLIEELEKLFLS
jgi:putative hydrolase of HD superfamily